MGDPSFKHLSRDQRVELAQLLAERRRRRSPTLIDSYFPDTGPLRRELYPKHMKFFALGSIKKERLALAANRIGKTETMGGYELVCHLTGRYPPWWPGRKFDRPIEAWAAGKTSQTTRDIIQKKLLGPKDKIGTGLIKKEYIHGTTSRRGVADAIETLHIKHVSGGLSELGFKSFDQGRKSFEGTKKDVVWLDEEAPLDVYTECLIRTTDTSGQGDNGIIMLTFTPLLGMSEVVLQFLPGGTITEREDGPKAVIMATWDDAPHLDEQTKQDLLASIPPFQRDARTKGIPQLGAGAIFPVPESDLLVTDFDIPVHWPRGYELDVGWNRTAALWGAIDQENDILYLTSEHYRGEAEPSVHAQSIRARGDWMHGQIDPAARGRGQRDGQQLIQNYIDLGLHLTPANNAVESGLLETWQRMSSGRLKVFKSLSNWLSEFRLYRRDEKGRIVKINDHLMDTTRYMVNSRFEHFKVKPKPPKEKVQFMAPGYGGGWMGG